MGPRAGPNTIAKREIGICNRTASLVAVPMFSYQKSVIARNSGSSCNIRAGKREGTLCSRLVRDLHSAPRCVPELLCVTPSYREPG